MSSAGSPRVVIAGAGVIGTACAYYLSRSGWNVTLVDQGRHAGGCSAGNCGYISPSHVLPPAEPGAAVGALRAMLRPNSPFSVKPRLDFGLWMWLLAFARRCNMRDMLAAAGPIDALLTSSAGLYRTLIADEGIDCERQERGLLFAFREPAAFNEFAETDRLLASRFHRPAVRLPGDELTRFESALRPGLAGAWHYPDDTHLRPDALMSGWRAVLERRGVRIIEHSAVVGFDRTGDRCTALRTAGGRLPADAFVVATGAWTPMLEQKLGRRLPIQPGKGYSLTMPRPTGCPTTPVIFPETRVAVTPMRSTWRLGSTMEFAGYDTSLPPARLRLLHDGAAPYLRDPISVEGATPWYGWRPMTPDGVPIIDRSPRMENVVIAAGHNMLGMSMGAGTGRLVAEMLSGSPTHVDPRPYRAGRF